MDWNRIEGNWKQLKGKVKEQWGHLTDDDLDKVAGKREQLEGKIQERYGIDKVLRASTSTIGSISSDRVSAYLDFRIAEGRIASIRCVPPVVRTLMKGCLGGCDAPWR
ncbi:MAG: hypothetical protein DLM68_05505 [Hyphomicrobiales bacterium]|nr:MAG: hypothetical protein DLM68_05505 [Hyphomicrobiales bacterium]